ncbi:MAG TPA: hypothetical protein VFH73_19565 [Polyangia bacterium]|jgi:hypothetical protein|nr:hypothetical protein [Polyangia bacterium]
MCLLSHACAAAALLSLLASVSACDGLVAGSTGTGGAAGDSVDPDPGVVIDPTGSGGTSTGPGGGVDPGSSPCSEYPTAPELTAARFEVGTVVPNLTFKREDGTTVSFGDLRCDKKNKILYWAVGGDNCPPCIATARSMEIPANTELGSQGLYIMESFNGRRFLVSRSPWIGFRAKTLWPADSDSIGLLDEPTTPPYYVQGRITNGIPWTVVIDLETMKVLVTQTRSVVTLRTLLAAAPPRP